MFRKEYYKELSEQKDSILLRLLLPAIGVMLLQVAMISLMLFSNGTIASLEQNARDSLVRNVEKRSVALEGMMVGVWSNLDGMEASLQDIVVQYAADNALDVADILGVSPRERALLNGMVDPLLDELLVAQATGVFVFLTGAEDAAMDAVSLNGAYFRDGNPGTASFTFADVSLEIGDVSLARKDGIQLSSIWKDKYTCDTSRPAAWDAIYAPIRMAVEQPGVRTVDLARWSEPHYLHAGKQDTELCITYARPLIVDGNMLGVFGIEVSLRYLEKFFPAEDIDGLGGYMLVRYDANAAANVLTCHVWGGTSSYIKRYADTGQTILFTPEASEGSLYTHTNERFGDVNAAVRPLVLYSRNAPFSAEQWALLALSPKDVLFEASNNVRMGILQSSFVALALGTLLMFLSIRHNTKPLLSIAGQITANGPDDPVVVKNSNTYEIMLLCDTINEMKDRRRLGELALREERERYMVALESATDTFIEYDIDSDRFTINYFVEENGKPTLTSRGVESFTRTIDTNGICHPADAEDMLAVLLRRQEQSKPVEVRMRTDMFPHITGADDEGYYWFLLKTVRIARGESASGKMIGSARQITMEKLAAMRTLEAQRRDSTTRLYNRDYGELLLERLADTACAENTDFHIYLVRLENFDRFEAYYGQVFSAMVLRAFSRAMLSDVPAERHNGNIIRWNNDEFVVFDCGTEMEEALERVAQMAQTIYTGENGELVLTISVSAYVSYTSFIAENGVRRPANIDLNVSQESIVSFSLDMFEHTTDLASVLQMLFRTLGEVFNVYGVLVCEHDQDFGASRIIHKWYADKDITPEYREHERFDPSDFAALEILLGEGGLLSYNSDDAEVFAQNVRKILCVPSKRSFSATCCAMYENGRLIGHVMFAASDKHHIWTNTQKHSLYEITKIIATHFSLQRSNSVSRAKSEFLSRMSHEIRTPMNAIIGMTKIARNAGADAVRVSDCLDKINASAKHLLALINDVLDMSQIERGKITVEGQPFNLAEWIDALDVLMRPQYEEKNISFRVERELSRPLVCGDEQKLWQVCLNLLGNAVKFTPSGGAVVLSVLQMPADAEGFNTVRFVVKDTGIGIAQEDQKKIFNAFEQGASNRPGVTHAKGTGLGLSICSGLVAAMGGRIEMESAPGKGSEFRFALRFASGETEPAAKDSPGKEKENAQERFCGYRVLIVDDTEINLEIASFLVESVGFTVEAAMDGREAVDKFFASPPGYYDVVFMDINMPVMDGLTATREIRKNTSRPDARTVPVLAMTANALSEDTKKSIESGMNAHIAKPIDTALLYTTLERLFPERRKQ